MSEQFVDAVTVKQKIPISDLDISIFHGKISILNRFNIFEIENLNGFRSIVKHLLGEGVTRKSCAESVAITLTQLRIHYNGTGWSIYGH